MNFRILNMIFLCSMFAAGDLLIARGVNVFLSSPSPIDYPLVKSTDTDMEEDIGEEREESMEEDIEEDNPEPQKRKWGQVFYLYPELSEEDKPEPKKYKSEPSGSSFRNLFQVEPRNKTPFIIMVEQGEAEQLRQNLEGVAGGEVFANLMEKDNQGRNLFTIAVLNDDIRTVKVLLQKTPKWYYDLIMRAPDSNGKSALDYSPSKQMKILLKSALDKDYLLKRRYTHGQQIRKAFPRKRNVRKVVR